MRLKRLKKRSGLFNHIKSVFSSFSRKNFSCDGIIKLDLFFCFVFILGTIKGSNILVKDNSSLSFLIILGSITLCTWAFFCIVKFRSMEGSIRIGPKSFDYLWESIADRPYNFAIYLRFVLVAPYLLVYSLITYLKRDKLSSISLTQLSLDKLEWNSLMAVAEIDSYVSRTDDVLEKLRSIEEHLQCSTMDSGFEEYLTNLEKKLREDKKALEAQKQHIIAITTDYKTNLNKLKNFHIARDSIIEFMKAEKLHKEIEEYLKSSKKQLQSLVSLANESNQTYYERLNEVKQETLAYTAAVEEVQSLGT